MTRWRSNMQIKLSEVIEALDNTTADRQYYYYIPEERIIEQDDETDIKQLIPLPSHKQIDDYSTMKNYIDQLDESEAKGWLEESIKGAGAFKRFRSCLERFGLTDNWLDYQYGVHEDIAYNWCEYHGIEYLEDEADYQRSTETVTEEKVSPAEEHKYRLIRIDQDNYYGLGYLLLEFRKILSSFKNTLNDMDVEDALEELKCYLNRQYPIFAVSDKGKYVGFAVCRIDDDVVWLESIYVKDQWRRKGLGKMLLDKAEEISKEYHNDTLYFYVHPNNDVMIAFLKDNGYDVLNLIEIRKAYPQEELNSSYTIGDHTYRY